ncbi:MAG: glycoside hydrolase family 32 protein [Lentisphaeria bacterium]|nr:glycoside hydrolase family 32 protein [Lentisphaeria bacterium]
MARPEYHFTAGRGWLNDPNGLVYHKGEYHLFFQHNPSDVAWGNIHWGHAVSRDLLHWEELGIALYPDPEKKDYCYSGSAVMDPENCAGFRTGEEIPMLVFYTSTGRGECLAYSNDRGRTFTEYEGNPILCHRGRDPKVIRFEAGNCWIMAVYEEVNHTAFYSSTDLKHWTFRSRIHGFYECPELFELSGKWVLMGGDVSYSIGRFDGETFEVETRPQKLFHGTAYAGQIFNGASGTILIAWMRYSGNAYDNECFCQQMTLPLKLTLDESCKFIRVNPAVESPGSRVLSSPDRPVEIDSVTVGPAEHILVVQDTLSVEIFVDHGREYHVQVLRRE